MQRDILMICALLVVMLINTIQGTTLANIKNLFKKETLLKGIYKSLTIAVSFAGLYIAIYFIPTFEIFGFTGADVITGITAVAIIKYATDIAMKLVELVGLSLDDFNDGENTDEGE